MTLYAVLCGLATGCGVIGGILGALGAAYVVNTERVPLRWWVPVVLLGVAAGLGSTAVHMGAP